MIQHDAHRSSIRRPPTVLLLHGWLHSPLVWDRVIAMMPSGVETVAPALPGFGGLHCNREFTSLKEYSQEVAWATPEAFACDHDVVAADSLGGLVALYLIEAGILRCRGLLLSGVPSCGLPCWLRLVSKLGAARLIKNSLSAFPVRWRYGLETRIARATGLVLGSAPRELDDGIGRADARVADQLLAMMCNVSTDQLPRPNLRTWVLRGDSDGIVNAKAGRALSRHLRCVYTEFRCSGHSLALDQPLLYAEAIREFLDCTTDPAPD
ncbi:MAG: alpha/beta hydrolase [Phycisphaerales bacterium]|nr:alpha/beta hydrolase [Phycisphaerales bacterium]